MVGTIRSVDASTRTLLVAHQAIESINMGAVTMPFRMADGLPMPDLKPGDAIALLLTQGAQGLAVSFVKKTRLSAVDAGAKGRNMENGMIGMQHGTDDGGSTMAMMEQCHQMMNSK